MGAFFSRTDPVTSPPPQNSESPQTYDPTKTYISFIIGDGDNVGYLTTSRRSWMEERVSKCQSGAGCWPLLWSISPHLPYLAPKMLQWYYSEALKTVNVPYLFDTLVRWRYNKFNVYGEKFVLFRPHE